MRKNRLALIIRAKSKTFVIGGWMKGYRFIPGYCELWSLDSLRAALRLSKTHVANSYIQTRRYHTKRKFKKRTTN